MNVSGLSSIASLYASALSRGLPRRQVGRGPGAKPASRV